ncbi:radical SAM protein [Clostridium estertheticum]|uniref:SPL family radical SAM protein n=1 Tax=Clostridium estertheticum TaxID=238834 RepID=UPI0013EE539B|nr:radical SAM protein [Clostridium estertheticum]MBZ9607382.1 radical SAM protein [Clostridium estertheticum]
MHYQEYKSILSPKNGMNIYRGCSHGCIYCDSRSSCYNMKHDFCDIEIKRNAPQMLEETLKRKRKKCMVGTGAMSDPYIHVEEELLYTRKCLEIIDKYGFGLSILTKSNRILRDLDLLKSINKKSKCVVQMTLTTSDEKLCSTIEPNVSTTKERFETLKIMSENGIPTVVWLSPFLPFINDSEENFQRLLDYCIEAKVYGIMCFGIGLTLREGNREYFYEKLDECFPYMKQKYIKTFGNSYECHSDNHSKLMKILYYECKKHSILVGVDNVFSYLNSYEDKNSNDQISLF